MDRYGGGYGPNKVGGPVQLTASTIHNFAFLVAGVIIANPKLITSTF